MGALYGQWALAAKAFPKRMQKVKNIYISHVECFITIDRYNPSLFPLHKKELQASLNP